MLKSARVKSKASMGPYNFNKLLLLDTFQDEATLSIINQYNPYYIDWSPPLIWEEYAHWILLERLSGS